jgi:hypothetical protein
VPERVWGFNSPLAHRCDSPGRCRGHSPSRWRARFLRPAISLFGCRGCAAEQARVAFDSEGGQCEATCDQRCDAPAGTEDPSDDQRNHDDSSDHEPEDRSWLDLHVATLRTRGTTWATSVRAFPSSRCHEDMPQCTRVSSWGGQAGRLMIVRGIRPETGLSALMIMRGRGTAGEHRPACMIVGGIRLESGRMPLTITGPPTDRPELSPNRSTCRPHARAPAFRHKRVIG